MRDSSVFWQVPLDGASVNGIQIDTLGADGTRPLAVLDTGTTVALGAHTAVHAIYAQVPGATVDEAVTFSMLGYTAEVYTFPCESISALPNVSLRLGGVDYAIYPPDLVVDLNGTTCTGALLALER